MVKMGTKLNYSMTCHPKTDDQTEVTYKILGTLLRALVKSNAKAWDMVFPHVEFTYNKALSKTIGMSPFKVVYRLDPLSPLDLIPRVTEENLNMEASKSVDEIQKLHKQVMAKIEKSKDFYQS